MLLNLANIFYDTLYVSCHHTSGHGITKKKAFAEETERDR